MFIFPNFVEFFKYHKYGECSDCYILFCFRQILFLMHSLLVLMKLSIHISGLSHEKIYITIDTMQKQNMNWFATALRVVICFIILTDLTEFSVEVLCGWSVRWSRRSRCEKKEERQELKLGDAWGTPSKYSRRLKRLSLGMPRKASPLSSSFIGNFTWS